MLAKLLRISTLNFIMLRLSFLQQLMATALLRLLRKMATVKRNHSQSICDNNYRPIHNSNCKRCELSRTCKSVCVIGQGNWKEATILIIGQAPTAREDETGFPLVNAAGRWLREQINYLEMTDLVYFTEAVKCRPPNDRKPTLDETFACSNRYLRDEIKALRPQTVVTLGRTAADAMGWQDKDIQSMPFFSAHAWGNFYCRITWHPAQFLTSHSATIAHQIRESLLWAKKFGQMENPWWRPRAH